MNKLIILFLLFSIKLHSQIQKPICAQICNTNSDSLTINEIIKCGELLPTDTNYNVHSFIISIGDNNFWQAAGSKITKFMELEISKLKRGDTVIFDNIKLKNKNGIIKWNCALKIVII